MKSTFLIPEINWASFTQKLDNLVEEGKKLETSISYRILKTVFLDYSDQSMSSETDLSLKEKYYEVEVEGSNPKLMGWQVVATMEFKEGKNIINVSPLFEGKIPQKYSTYRGCDHCQTKRRRKYFFLLKREKFDEFICVGRNCLDDFIGHGHPLRVADFFTRELQSITSFQRNGTTNEDNRTNLLISNYIYFPVRDIFAIFFYLIESKGGYFITPERREALRKQRVYEISLQQQITEFIDFFQYSYPELKEEITQTHYLGANRLLDWHKKKQKEYPSRESHPFFEASLLIDEGYVYCDDILDLIPVIEMYYHKTGQYKEYIPDPRPSEWVGEVGERIEFQLAIKGIEYEDTYWGTKKHYIMRDQNNNLFIWITQSIPEIVEGEKYNVKATIKDHVEESGLKITYLSRLACIN